VAIEPHNIDKGREEKKPKRWQNRTGPVKREKRYEEKTLNLLKSKEKLTKIVS